MRDELITHSIPISYPITSKKLKIPPAQGKNSLSQLSFILEI